MNPTITTADGLMLGVREWPLVDARGSVLVVHGLGEHIGRYAHVAARFNAWGWSVVGYDQRGHGESDGARGALARHDDLLRDLALVFDAVRANQPGPLVLLGHSLGGLITARFVAERIRSVDALVLSSPALDLGMRSGQKLLLSLLGRIAPNLRVHNGLKPEWVSRDPAVVKDYANDPRVHDRVTPKLVRFMLDSIERVRSRAAQWAVPTLLMYAGSDRCVVPGGSAAFAAAAPKSVVTVREFAPLYHELFNEPEQKEVFEVLGDWLNPDAALAVDPSPEMGYFRAPVARFSSERGS
jgi:alpha-beta hydrolase superfamily lysophospholipase